MTVPYATPPTAVAGQPLAAADWNAKVRDSIEHLAKPPRCIVSRDSLQSIPHNVVTLVIFNVEEVDTDGMWSAAQPTRLIAPVTGTYQFSGGGNFAANATGSRSIVLTKNGVYIGGFTAPGSTWYCGTMLSLPVTANAGDYFELLLYQTSGAALNFDPIYTIQASLILIAR